MPVPRRVSAALAAAALLCATAGCTGGDDPESQEPETAPSTPLASYAADQVVLQRAPFCDRISETAAAQAVDGEVARASAYDNGERTRLTADVRDVAHEYGCTFDGEGATADAWLFAPPVTPERADDLIRLAGKATGCRPDPQDPGFGQRSVATVCTADGRLTASYHGLFGDAWLNCSVTVAEGDVDATALQDRAGRWCVQVAEAARA